MAELRDFLKPDLETHLRPDPETNPDGARYVRTFLWMRLGVGALGLVLPVALIILDSVVFEGHPFIRGSMSAYYYSGMREFFVGAIFGSGAFLLAYKVSEVSLDNTAAIGAGVCAWLVAMFPTGLPSLAEHPKPLRPPLNPLQDLIGEGWVKGIHYGRRRASSSAWPYWLCSSDTEKGSCRPSRRSSRRDFGAPSTTRAHSSWVWALPGFSSRRSRTAGRALVHPAGRMGLHLGMGALVAAEGRRVGHALREAGSGSTH